MGNYVAMTQAEQREWEQACKVLKDSKKDFSRMILVPADEESWVGRFCYEWDEAVEALIPYLKDVRTMPISKGTV